MRILVRGARLPRADHALAVALEVDERSCSCLELQKLTDQQVSARLAAYTKAMEQMTQRYPDDYEAQVFYALTLQASASKTDMSYGNQLKSVAILEKLFEPDFSVHDQWQVQVQADSPFRVRPEDIGKLKVRNAAGAMKALTQILARRLHVHEHDGRGNGARRRTSASGVASPSRARRSRPGRKRSKSSMIPVIVN